MSDIALVILFLIFHVFRVFDVCSSEYFSY